MSKKLAIVTGGTAGIGLETAIALAKSGFDLVITGRSKFKAESALEKLSVAASNAKVDWVELDLSDLDSVRFFSRWLGSRKWDLLVNNAGAKVERPFKTTKQGFEWHIGVNHIAHLFLSQVLVNRGRDGARIVFVSSIVARRSSGMLLNNYESQSPGVAYRDSKLANLVTAINLGKALAENDLDITVTMAHPGFTRASAYGTKLIRAAEVVLAQPASTGAKPVISACFSEANTYWGPKYFELWGPPTQVNLPESVVSAVDKGEIWSDSLGEIRRYLAGEIRPN